MLLAVLAVLAVVVYLATGSLTAVFIIGGIGLGLIAIAGVIAAIIGYSIWKTL